MQTEISVRDTGVGIKDNVNPKVVHEKNADDLKRNTHTCTVCLSCQPGSTIKGETASHW